MIKDEDLSAKDQIIEFINLAFLIVLVMFIFFYIFIGQRFGLFSRLLAYSPLVIAAAPFMLVWRLKRREKRKFRRDRNLDEAIVYPDKFDIWRDRIISASAPLCVIIMPLLDRMIETDDYYQSAATAVLAGVWHYILFRPKEAGKVVYLTHGDRIKDDMFIYFAPVVTIFFGVAAGIDMIDYFETVAVFVILYIRHFFLFGRIK